MIILGLTGSIGMGKSTTAGLFAEAGAALYDADAAVHAVYAPGGAAIGPVSAAFGDVLDEDGGVDRRKLAAALAGDPSAFSRLEAIVHPLVAAIRTQVVETARAEGRALVVLDVPLLFETGGDSGVDKVVVVSAPAEVQRARVMARPGMTEAKFEALLARQAPDAEKRARADYVIDTSLGVDAARAQVRDIVDNLSGPA